VFRRAAQRNAFVALMSEIIRRAGKSVRSKS
jgi:hypothetical protein